MRAVRVLEPEDDIDIAGAVMDPSDTHVDCDPVEDGFAALRAQSAQRKRLMREHKRTSVEIQAVQSRAATSRVTRCRAGDGAA